MTPKEKELIMLACQEQINNLLQYADPNNRERALIVEVFNSEGHPESEVDYVLANFIEELELLQEDPEQLLKAHWFNLDAIKHILNKNFRGSLVKALGAEPHLENLLLMLYTKSKFNIQLSITLN